MQSNPAFSEEKLLKGTTTIGMVLKDGVVLATERRATAGNLIANKSTQKLFKIDQNIGMTVAGLVGDAQLLARYLRAEVSLYRLRRSAPLSAEGAATLLANILSGNRMFPYYAWLILGGVDSAGGHVFSVDPAGGSIEDRYVSVGSGSTFAYGLLEEGYSRDLNVSDGVDLAIRGLTVAMKRDSASGDGYTIHTITSREYREFSEEEINKRLKALKIPLPPVLA
ncbi:MAG: archaeal proteasome endopeptidase complex subunit beta [Thermoplasmata archaeon]|nr:archaeal proteasome endopeptidase complex subunit beta [Thermoplasmata archaeon]MCI4359883.1 archaeal proteasome endopeptidase complex subunit beta [Thermoplasmata archaeon]